MARYTGPRAKIARKFSESIFGAMKAVTRKPYPPGQHGKGRRRKQSEYAKQLNEKQKVKYTYGVLEKQFANIFKKASAKSGITGDILLQLLETRLDNIVYRLGIAPTRRAARQLVSHKHITVNGRIMNIPSFQVKIDDLVGVREKSKSLELISKSLELQLVNKYPWLQWDENQHSGRLAILPNIEEIPEKIETQLIVELYSK